MAKIGDLFFTNCKDQLTINSVTESEYYEKANLSFINSISKETKLFFADINSKHTPSSKDMEGIKNISILIGPEGDFSPSERELILKKSNVIPFSLSKNILRTDTAVISAISLVNFINNNH